MVIIPSPVKKMMEVQQMILVGTSNKQGIPNVSPRSSFCVEKDSIYWCEIFKHKSFQNFMKNNWISVSVVDTSELSGYQLKGKVKEVSDEKLSSQITSKILENLPKKHEDHIRKLILEHDTRLLQFIPLVIYSLNPAEIEKNPHLLESDVDINTHQELRAFSMLDYT